jgi:hypothetical protein
MIHIIEQFITEDLGLTKTSRIYYDVASEHPMI